MRFLLLCLATLLPLSVKAQNQLTDYADLVEKLSPAVVNISIKSTPKLMQGGGGMPNPFEGTPWEDFFQQFNQGMPQEELSTPRQSMGTGVIISGDGFVVTNNHVVEGADEITVKLEKNKHSFPAKVVGRDAKTDLALLKIKATAPLPFATFGTSSNLRVGQAVLAIGNPFGLGGTVTSGIVSALARNIGQGPYDDFIQTDVAINPGNSGGPLYNAAGEVVGINSTIFTRSGGSNGISFAIPIDVVKTVVSQLKTNGKVARGWLGVRVQSLTPDLAESFGLKEPVGALVAEITPQSPAANAGIKEGDIILSFNGKTVDELNDLPKLVAMAPLGSTAQLQILRAGKPLQLKAKVAPLPADEADPAPHEETAIATPDRIGLVLRALTLPLRQQLGVPDEVKGLMVIKASGTAKEAGILPNDIIAEADWKRVTDIMTLRNAIQKKAGKTLLLRVWREDGYLFISVPVATE